MPSSAVVSAAGSTTSTRPEDLTSRLSAAGGDGLMALKAVRQVKNQIIGNKTKKLCYLNLGAVPKIVSILASAVDADFSSCSEQLIVQAAASVGSFACGLDDGVRAVLDAGAVPLLTRILSSSDDKIVDAGARSLRMIFQSKLAPKYDILQENNRQFILSLLNSGNENVTELAASIITHSCMTISEQKSLADTSVLQRLIQLLDGSLNQRDASLNSIATIVKNNSDVVKKFMNIDGGKALSAIIELMKDRHPRTKYLACLCLIFIGNASQCYAQELTIKTKLILILFELLEEPSSIGDDAPFALINLIEAKEELQKHALSINAVEKLGNFLKKGSYEVKRIQGILLALAELCSTLEKGRCQLLSLEAFNRIVDSLNHESAIICIAACTCLRNISRSVKNLSAGHFNRESIVLPLKKLLNDQSVSVQVAALQVICNIVVCFSTRKSVFIECGGVKELDQLSRSMDSTLRVYAVQAWKNLLFSADRRSLKVVLPEISESSLSVLICDSEAYVQEQALGLVCNIISGCNDAIDKILSTGISDTISRQLCQTSSTEVCIQGMFIFCNIACGNSLHKDITLNYILQTCVDGNGCIPVSVKFLQSKNDLLRLATIWCMINLVTDSNGPEGCARASKLFDAGVTVVIGQMVNDPNTDVKYRARSLQNQFAFYGYSCT